jgi:hypothetical protein
MQRIKLFEEFGSDGGSFTSANLLFMNFLIDRFLTSYRCRTREDRIDIVKFKDLFSMRRQAILEFISENSELNLPKSSKTGKQLKFSITADLCNSLNNYLNRYMEDDEIRIMKAVELETQFSYSKFNTSIKIPCKIPRVYYLLIEQMIQKLLPEYSKDILRDKEIFRIWQRLVGR